jgi:transposase
LTARIEDPADTAISDMVKSALGYLVIQLRRTEASLAEIETKLTAVARKVEACRRLMTIPGVGVITATALASSVRDASDFKSGRHFAAWLGLVPRQHSTGGVEKLGGISKRGDSYLRRLLVHGARSVMRWRRKSWAWLARIRDRRPANVVAVAMANKTARVVWALLRYGGEYTPTERQAA